MRNSVDLVRLVAYGFGIVIWLVFVARPSGVARTFDVLVIDLAQLVPDWVRLVLRGLSQMTAAFLPVIVLASLRKRPRVLFTAVLTFVASLAVRGALDLFISRRLNVPVVEGSRIPSLVIGSSFPSVPFVGALAALTVVLGPVVGTTWRRWLMAAVAFVSVERCVNAEFTPLNAAITLTLGAVVGSVMLVVLGSPRRVTTRRALMDGLAGCGFTITSVEVWQRESRHSLALRARCDDGRELFVRLINRDDRDADMLLRAWRRLRLKGLDDDVERWDESQLADHEALVAFQAQAAGVPVARPLASGSTADGSGLLVFDIARGRRLSDLDPSQLTDAHMRAGFAAVERLHRAGIAHRWCSPDHLLLDHDGVVRVLDFRWAVRAAADVQKSADIAQLVVGFAAIVGAEPAVRAAVAALGTFVVDDALPYVQPLVLPSEVRARIKEEGALLGEVRAAMQSATGGRSYELAEIKRITWGRTFAVIGGIGLIYAVLGFASNWADVTRAFRSLPPGILPVLVVLAAVPYITGPVALVASLPSVAIPFREAVPVMMAQSFLNRFTPAGAGGMALQMRYLQVRGVPSAVAATSIAMRSVVSGLAQFMVLIIFVAWTKSGGVALKPPSINTVALGVAVVAAAAGVVWLTPWGRRVVAWRVQVGFRQMRETAQDMAQHPREIMIMFGALFLNGCAVLSAFIVACSTIDVHLSIGTLGIVYFLGTAVGGASPTPGGAGGMEAALIAALTAAGAAGGPAFAAVFVFRAITYWLPVPFCWVALARVNRYSKAQGSAVAASPAG